MGANTFEKYFGDQTQPRFFSTGLLRVLNVKIYFLKRWAGDRRGNLEQCTKVFGEMEPFPEGALHGASIPGACFGKHWFRAMWSSDSCYHFEQN